MSQTSLTLTTWGCQCEYSQDFDPANAERWQQFITGDSQLQRIAQTKGLSMPPQGKCPACWLGLNDERTIYDRDLYGITDLDALATTVSASDTDLESRKTEVRDEYGRVAMEQVGEHYELRVNQGTGEISTELVPVYEPKLRPLTETELAELKQQRDRNLDSLAAIAVQEVSPDA